MGGAKGIGCWVTCIVISAFCLLVPWYENNLMKILSGALTLSFACCAWSALYLVNRVDPGVVLPTDAGIDCVPPGAEPMEEPSPDASHPNPNPNPNPDWRSHHLEDRPLRTTW